MFLIQSSGLYVKSADNSLYFMDDGGTEYNITLGEDYIAGDYLICANDIGRSTGSSGWVKLKESIIDGDGTLRITYSVRGYGSVYNKGVQVYRNDIPVGPVHNISGTEQIEISEDISGWSKGDLVQLWAAVGYPGDVIAIDNFRIYVGNLTAPIPNPSY